MKYIITGTQTVRLINIKRPGFLSVLINIQNQNLCHWVVGKQCQPELIISDLNLPNRISNLVSSTSRSAAASGTEEETSRRHTGTRFYRTPPPPVLLLLLLLFLALSFFRLLLVSLHMHDKCFMLPIEKRR